MSKSKATIALLLFAAYFYIGYNLLELFLYPMYTNILSYTFKANQLSVLCVLPFLKRLSTPKTFLSLTFLIFLVVYNLFNIPVLFDEHEIGYNYLFFLRELSCIVPLLSLCIAYSLEWSVIERLFNMLRKHAFVFFAICMGTVIVFNAKLLIYGQSSVPISASSGISLVLPFMIAEKSISASFPYLVTSLATDILSQKRTALVALLPVIIDKLSQVPLRISTYSLSRSLPLYLFSIISVFLICLSVLLANPDLRLSSVLVKAFSEIDNVQAFSLLTSGRTDEIMIFLSQIADNPLYILTGVPYNQPIVACSAFSMHDCDIRYYLHSNIFSYAYQGGILVSILVYIGILRTLRYLYRHISVDPFAYILFMVTSVFIITSLAGSILTLYSPIWLVIGIAERYSRNKLPY
jgi:hypothetical protein